MGASKLQHPDADTAHAFARIVLQTRALFFAHAVAFLGTGFAALVMAPAPKLLDHIAIGEASMTVCKFLWVGWPFLASFGMSRSRLPGNTLAFGVFLVLLAAVSVGAGVFLDTPLAANSWGWDVFQITFIEAGVLMVAADLLADLKSKAR